MQCLSLLKVDPENKRKTASGVCGKILDVYRGFAANDPVWHRGCSDVGEKVVSERLLLTPDPLIQDPYFSQSYNRYAYVFNNPLSRTDPSGYQSQGQDSTGFHNGTGMTICIGGCGSSAAYEAERSARESANAAGAIYNFQQSMGLMYTAQDYAGRASGYGGPGGYSGAPSGYNPGPSNPTPQPSGVSQSDPRGPGIYSGLNGWEVAAGLSEFANIMMSMVPIIGPMSARTAPARMPITSPNRLLPSPSKAGPHYPPNDGFIDSAPFTLLPGTKIDRYGSTKGRFVADKGTPFGQRSLPQSQMNSPYNVYTVQQPLTVQAGIASPWFGQPGLGMQYKLPNSVQSLTSSGVLK